VGSLINRELGGSRSEERAPDPRIAQVVEIVDGDTIRVRFVSGTVRTIRYIGIDAPPTPATGAEPGCFGAAATEANRRLVAGESVRLEFDKQRQDDAGQLLAYVYRARDQAFVNGRLLAGGYATVLTLPPNVRHVPTFLGLARTARETGRGLWKACDTAAA